MEKRAKGGLLVSSLGRCFICLGKVPELEIEKEDKEKEEEKGKKIENGEETGPGTASTSKPASSAPAVDSDKSTFKCFQYVSHYLKFDKAKLFNPEQPPPPPSLLLNMKKMRLKVELCEECEEINGDMESLYIFMERCRVELESRVGVLQEKISKANGSSLPNELRRLAEERKADMEKINILQRARQETLEKCAEKLKKSAPQLTIEKIQGKPEKETEEVPNKNKKQKVMSKLTPISSSSTSGAGAGASQNGKVPKFSRAGNDAMFGEGTASLQEEKNESEENLPGPSSSMPYLPLPQNRKPGRPFKNPPVLLSQASHSTATSSPNKPRLESINPKSKAKPQLHFATPQPKWTVRNRFLHSKSKAILPPQQRAMAFRTHKVLARGNGQHPKERRPQQQHNKQMKSHPSTSTTSNLHQLPEFKCVKCKKGFSSLSSLRKHNTFLKNCKKITSLSHFENPNYQVNCKYCGKLYHNGSLHRHINAVHLQQRWNCTECQNSFSQYNYLKHHMKKIHEIGADGIFKCDKCNKIFTRKIFLTQHKTQICVR